MLYNGSSNNPACRQFDQVVLKGKGGVISWGNGEDAWQEKPPSPTDVTEVSNSPFGAEFGEVRIFTFDVPASAVGNCDSPDASAPSIQAHMGALPAITHNVFIHSDGSSLALIPTSLKLEAGVPAELAITGLSPNGTRIPLPVRDFQWSVKVVKTGNLMPLPRSQKGTITYWGNPGTGSATPPTATYISAPLVLRAEVDKLSILGLVQGTYNLTATDSLNRSACVRVQVSKTLVPMFGAVYPGPLDAGLQFIAASPAPDAALTPGQEVVVSGTVVKPGGKFSHLCGLLELSLADDSVGSTSLLYMEPHRLQIYDGNVSSKAKIVDLTGMASNPKLTFEIVDLVLHAPEMRPPSPDLSFSIADEVIGSYDGPNKLGSLLKDWLGWELPIVEGQSYYDSFAVFTADVPADEDLLVKFTSGICEPYWQYLAPIYTVGLQMPPGGVLVKPGEPAIVHLRRNPAY